MLIRTTTLAPVILYIICIILQHAYGFWDTGTTTVGVPRDDTKNPRTAFFEWEHCESERFTFWKLSIFGYEPVDWVKNYFKRLMSVVAGISIDFLPLGTAAILNRRTLITAANFLEPYMNRQSDLRIWALGRAGLYNTPFRYRVWRVRRLLPKSNNPEHWHGPRGVHSPRHDVCIIHSYDQMYIYTSKPVTWMYPYRTYLVRKHEKLDQKLVISGSGYQTLTHIRDNYVIKHFLLLRENVVDCSKFLPKWWGKFICIRNVAGLAGLQNGGSLFSNENIVGVGCFEIRYNEDRIYAFTDLRYYVDWIHIMANITDGEYYEYAYPQWGVAAGWLFYDSGLIGKPNSPRNPLYQQKHWKKKIYRQLHRS